MNEDGPISLKVGEKEATAKQVNNSILELECALHSRFEISKTLHVQEKLNGLGYQENTQIYSCTVGTTKELVL